MENDGRRAADLQPIFPGGMNCSVPSRRRQTEMTALGSFRVLLASVRAQRSGERAAFVTQRVFLAFSQWVQSIARSTESHGQPRSPQSRGASQGCKAVWHAQLSGLRD